jgi:hypothetical protein
MTVFVASLDDVILMKRTAGRPTDLSVVENLKVLKKMRQDLAATGEQPPDE